MDAGKSEKTGLLTRIDWAPLVLIVVGVAVYANSLSGPFVFDDTLAIEVNEYVRQPWPLGRLLLAPEHSPTQARPIVSLSLAVNHAIGGLEVRGYRIVNIALHILCSLVLFGVVRRALRSERLRQRFGGASGGIALVCALLWLVHPVQSECINYISQRSESLMALFYLLTLYCAIRAIRCDRRKWWYGASVLSCALGMACKQPMITAPAMVLLFDLVFWPGTIRQMLRRRWVLYAGLAATWGVLATLMIRFHDTNVTFSGSVTAVQYAMHQCVVVVRYLRMAIWPHPLALDYGWAKVLPLADVAPSAAALAVVLIATIAAIIYRPMIGFLGAWFFVILSPTSSFVPLQTEVGAERRMYLPLAGLTVLVVIAGYVCLSRVAKRLPKRGAGAGRATAGGFKRWAGAVLVIVVAGAMSWATARRNEDYRSTVSIWRTAVNALPQVPRAHYNLALALQLEGELDEAIRHYRQAIQLDPNYPDAHNNVGNALAAQGRPDEAIDHFRQAIRLIPHQAGPYNNLGRLLAAQGKPDEAIRHFRRALDLEPDHAGAHNNLGIALASQGRLDEAIGHFRRAVQLEPDRAGGYCNLGNALAAKGQVEEAIGHYRRTLQLDPGYAEAHLNLGTVLLAKGQTDEAIRHYRLGLRTGPGRPEAHYRLANLLSAKARWEEAIVHYRRALRFWVNHPAVSYGLGKALVKTGRVVEGLTHLRQAGNLEPNWPAPWNALARILATHPDAGVRDGAAAVRLAQRAGGLTKYRDPTVLDTLAAAYAETGRFDEAVAAVQTGIEIASAAGAEAVAASLRQRLRLYRQKKPYREPVRVQGTTRP